jgi:hypothetical protein
MSGVRLGKSNQALAFANRAEAGSAGSIVGYSIAGIISIFGIVYICGTIYTRYHLSDQKDGDGILAYIKNQVGEYLPTEKTAVSKTNSPPLPGKIWENGMFIFFIVLALFCFGFAAWYKMKNGMYSSTAESVNTLLTIRRQALGSITSRAANKHSVTLSITNGVSPYNPTNLPSNKTPLVNWRPLTVRLAGYLGGVNDTNNGVFDMEFGISNSIHLGARSFIFDIDYLDNYPCAPLLIHQDTTGVHRSLNTGSIKDGMAALSKYAFNGDTSNYDPVIIVLYFRRIPTGTKQKKIFYTAVAQALDPISKDHLGSTEQGNFHNYTSENQLFTTAITNFKKKFIVLSNHPSSDIGNVTNPKENLNFWTNARLYVDTMGENSSLSTIIPSSNAAVVRYATIGDASSLLNLSTANQATYVAVTNVYKIALCPVENLNTLLTKENLSKLLNTLGINSIPLDVLHLGSQECHASSIVNPLPSSLTVENLANGKSTVTGITDPLSFWSYAGWSPKLITESFTNYVKATPIPGFVIPQPVVPKRPPPSTNSNGGLVSIA